MESKHYLTLSLHRHRVYAAVWVALYAAHVYYLAFIKFDYGYNMAASVGAGRSQLVRVLQTHPELVKVARLSCRSSLHSCVAALVC